MKVIYIDAKKVYNRILDASAHSKLEEWEIRVEVDSGRVTVEPKRKGKRKA